MPSMKPKPGEIWLADLGLAAKVRPVLILSRHDPDAPRALTIYAPSLPNTVAAATKSRWESFLFWTVHLSSTCKASAR